MPRRTKTSAPDPACPRCGYDLTGAVATWEMRCPLVGVCSECGLDFEWVDVLDPRRRELPWLYEHAPRWWSVKAALGTFLRALLIYPFWSRVRLTHEVRVKRLMAWPFVLAAMPFACAIAVSLGAWFLYGAGFVTSRLAVLTPTLSDITTWMQIALGVMLWPDDKTVLWFLAAAPLMFSSAAFSLVCVIVLSVARSERRKIKVRKEHIWRIGVYSLVPSLVLSAGNALYAMIVRTDGVASDINPLARGGPLTRGGVPAQYSDWLVDVVFIWVQISNALAELGNNALRFAFVVVILWQCVWWFTALKIGLKLKRPWRVGAAAIIAGVLVYFVVFLQITVVL